MARRHHATMQQLDGLRAKFAGITGRFVGTVETAAGAWLGGTIEGRTDGGTVLKVPINLGVGVLFLAAGHLEARGRAWSAHLNNLGNGFVGSYIAATGYAFGKRWKETGKIFGGGGHPWSHPYDGWRAIGSGSGSGGPRRPLRGADGRDRAAHAGGCAACAPVDRLALDTQISRSGPDAPSLRRRVRARPRGRRLLRREGPSSAQRPADLEREDRGSVSCFPLLRARMRSAQATALSRKVSSWQFVLLSSILARCRRFSPAGTTSSARRSATGATASTAVAATPGTVATRTP